MSRQIEQEKSRHSTNRKWLRAEAWVLAGAVGLLATTSHAWNPLLPPEVEAARIAPRDLVGDLGGVPVTIPRHFANYVEYEGDPGWGEKRKGPIPQRTHQSKLISFGYETRFPDMAGESTAELRKDKASYPASQTPWIDVGINTGRNYPGEGFLDRSATHIRKSGEILKHEQYAQLPNNQYGLTVYAATGIDPKTGKPYRENRDAHDLFVHRDKTGRVDAYIKCSNRNVPAPPCQHDFGLEPNMRAWVAKATAPMPTSTH